ncbi:hydrolase [Pontibacter sp. JAM-7]|uniref:hydrolase n=1 Tax=Pontibacter sp. JAM-7 TaxID=3366581 RepID=UPI003AF99155
MTISCHLPDSIEADVLKWCAAQQASMVARLETLVAINSGSDNPDGINRCGEQLQQWYRASFPQLQCQRHHLDGGETLTLNGVMQPRKLGDLWQFRLRPDAPLQILLCGHLDTVFSPSHPFQQGQYLSANLFRGPGASDMKGGLLVMLNALQTLEQHPDAQQVGWTVLLNPDEEVGSPGSAPWLQQAATQHHLGLVYEPALPGGDLAGQRKGSANYTLQVTGRSAHAGRNPEQGRNAIALAAEITLELQRLNGQQPGLSLNTGVIQGGHSTNQVPDKCVLRFNIRIAKPEDAIWCQQQLDTLIDHFRKREGFELRIQGGFSRLPKLLDSAQLSLYRHVQALAQELNLALQWHATGGCCDGNNLAAAGLTNIDTLGVRGSGIHSDQEQIELDSLTERSRLSALLLIRLAKSGWPMGERP